MFSLALPSQSRAQNFTTTLHSTYDVHEDASTQVTHDFSITNSVSTQYVTTYAFELAGTRIKDIAVSSNGKSLEFKQTKGRNTTNISFSFPDKIVGTGKAREFEVKYESDDTTTKIGKTVEVSIPRLSDASLFSDYTVTLKIPTAFGSPVSTQPHLFTTSSEAGKTTLQFSNLQDQTGISVSFGKEQYAKVKLGYHLANKSSAKASMQIALPPDNTYQRVYYDSIQPAPESIKQDADGNWLASFPLEGNQNLDISASFYSVTQAIPQENASLLGRKPDTRYTSSQQYWQANDAEISRIARDLHTAEDIYAYVIRTLHYDYTKPLSDATRLGAVGALSNPNSSLCTEFTDLFIAIARKKGIPARAVIGFAYSQNSDLRPLGYAGDILHTWPEYWDETMGTWIAIDPTWGQTTGGMDYFHHMDFNRIVFATQGLSSSNPVPAGMYKSNDQESKDIQTEFLETVPAFPDTFSTSLHIRPRTLLGLTDTYAITVKNTSLHAVYAVPLTLIAENQDGKVQIDNKITLIPLEEKEIPVQLPRKGLFSQGTSIITVTIGGQEFTHELTLKNTIRQYFPLIVITVLVGTSIGVCIFITRRLLVPRWQR